MRWWRRWWIPLTILLGTRVAGAALFLLAGDRQGAHLGDRGPWAAYLHAIVGWDGGWYRQIVENGYPRTLPTDGVAIVENAWAFFPLYPGLVRVVTWTGLPFPVAASLVSLVATALALCLCFALLEHTGGRVAATLGTLALALHPAAPVLQAAYSESVALAVLLGALWCVVRRRYRLLLLVLVVLALARPLTLPFALVIGAHHWLRRREAAPFPPHERRAVALAGAVALLGFGLWPAVCALVTGQPDAYLRVQRAWLPSGGDWPTWIGRFLTAGEPAALVVPAAILGGLAYLLLRPGARLWAPELRTWAFGYAVYLLGLLLAGSAVRFSLLMIVPWWPLPEIGAAWSRARLLVLVGAVTCLGLLGQYLWLSTFWFAPYGGTYHP